MKNKLEKPTPYKLEKPTPYKLEKPTPYNQNFKPYTVQPKLETLNLKRRQWRHQKRNGEPYYI